MSQPIVSIPSRSAATSPTTLGQLRASKEFTEARVSRSVKDELRANLIRRLQDQASGKNAEPIFPGIIGFDDTVVPQIINAILSRQNFILLGSARPGEEPHPARADRTARSRCAVCSRIGDSR